MSDEPLALSTILPAQSAAAEGETARAMAQTRAAADGVGSLPALSPRPPDPSSTALDIVSAAERLRDIAWRMRACGVEPGASDQIEQIAQAILSAPTLRDPADHRAQKLAEVLGYLEHRIDRLLDGHWELSRAQPDGSGTMPVLAIEPPPHRPAASSESSPDSIALQVEQDLLSLTEFPLHASAPAEAGTATRQLPAEAVAPAAPSAWQRALPSPPAAFAEHSDAWSPVPSMWEPPARDSASSAAFSGDDPEPPPSPTVDPALADLSSSKIAAQVIATSMAPMPRAEVLPPPAGDPLAALRAMSEEQRIALFT